MSDKLWNSIVIILALLFVLFLVLVVEIFPQDDKHEAKTQIIIDGRDTVLSQTDSLINGEITSFFNDYIMIKTYSVNKEFTIKIIERVDTTWADSNYSEIWLVTDTIKVESQGTIKTEKTGTSEQAISSIIPKDAAVAVVKFPVLVNEYTLTILDNYRLVEFEQMARDKDKSYEMIARKGGGIKPIYAFSTNAQFVVLFFNKSEMTERLTYAFIAYNLESPNRKVEYKPFRSAYAYKGLKYPGEI